MTEQRKPEILDDADLDNVAAGDLGVEPVTMRKRIDKSSPVLADGQPETEIETDRCVLTANICHL